MSTQGMWVVMTSKGIICECDSEQTARVAADCYREEGRECWVHYCD